MLHSIDEDEDLVSRWGELNWRFHATLFAPAERPRLLSVIKAQHTAFERYIRVYFALSNYEKPQQEHYELLDTCPQGEENAAIDLLTRHIQDTGEMLLSHLKSSDPDKDLQKTSSERGFS